MDEDNHVSEVLNEINKEYQDKTMVELGYRRQGYKWVKDRTFIQKILKRIDDVKKWF